MSEIKSQNGCAIGVDGEWSYRSHLQEILRLLNFIAPPEVNKKCHPLRT